MKEHKTRQKRSNRSPLWRLPVASEVREELELHLELRSREYEAQGLPADEARRRALERFGDLEHHAAACRREAGKRNRRWRWSAWFDEMRQDLRFAARQLRRRPGLAFLLVGMLAVGIGTTTTVAGMMHQALWQPLPYADPDGLVTIWEEQTSRGNGLNVVGPANFVAFREAAESLDGIAGFITVAANLAGDDGPPIRAKLRWITDGYFDLVGVPPVIGTFGPADTFDEEHSVVIISYGLWQERFGGRPDVVGELVPVDGLRREIVGVMPPEAALDMGASRAPYGDAPDLWAPMPVREDWATAPGRWLMVLARLAPGAEPAAADAEVAGIMKRQTQVHPDFNAGWTAHAVPVADYLREPLRLPLGALAGAVLIVLLIVCINASSLLLSRNLARGDELTLRRALGAGRARLTRQLLAEGLLVASLAGALGWLLASRLRILAAATLPQHLAASATAPPAWVWPATLGATGLFVLTLAWLPGLPALGRVTRLVSSRAIGGARGQHRLRAGLVFAQTALALVLLVGSALMLQTVYRLLAVDPGFDTDGIVSFGLSLPRGIEEPQVFGFYDELLMRLDALPGIESVGAISHVPMTGGAATIFAARDRPEPEAGQWPVADVRIIRGEAFGALGVDLVQGRSFDSSDGPEQEAGSVVVSRMLADALWPGDSAIDRELKVHWGEPERMRRIVGVVEDVHHVDPGTIPRAAIYFPHAQESQRGMSLVLRSDRDLASLAPDIRRVVGELDATLPLFDLHTVRSILRDTLADRQFLARVISGFAALAFFLSVLGIYGVTALSVTESRREIGLRVALGARPREVVAVFLRRVAIWTLAALAVGLTVAVLAGRAVEGLFFGVEAAEPSVLAGVALLVAAAALVAAVIPARRAARIDPSHALRCE